MHLEFTRETSTQMPAVGAALAVTSLRVWHCKFKTLASLSSFQNLRYLKIASYPDESLKPLESLRALEWLSIMHAPEVRDLESLTELPELRSLELATLPSWDSSRKRQVVASLDPLTRVPKLQHLNLFGFISEDKSLEPVERCQSLVTARFSGYPAREQKRFFATSRVRDAFIPAFPEA